MAVVRTENAATLRICVETGTTSSGAAKYSVRTIPHINPELDDASAHEIGTALAALQIYPFGYLQVVETAVLAEEA